jgi:hypothetical protein
MQGIILVFVNKTSLREPNSDAVLASVAAVDWFARVTAGISSAERLGCSKVVVCVGLLHDTLPNGQQVLGKRPQQL